VSENGILTTIKKRLLMEHDDNPLGEIGVLNPQTKPFGENLAFEDILLGICHASPLCCFDSLVGTIWL